MKTATISQEAIRLRELSLLRDVYLMLQLYCPGRQVGLPYRQRMAELPINEMNLSVRSSSSIEKVSSSPEQGNWK